MGGAPKERCQGALSDIPFELGIILKQRDRQDDGGHNL
jgi:hypothetical protein